MVTTPSKLVSMVVSKAINMANTINKPIVGLVNNMAYVKCDKCGNEINIYKQDDSNDVANRYGLEVLGRLPIDAKLAELADDGLIEEYTGDYLSGVTSKL